MRLDHGLIIFGKLIVKTGGGEFFLDLAMAIMGRRRGGAAKISVISSALFGSISGSAVSNVATTGAAPLGLESTGDPVFNLPASFIGAPAVSLPCLSAETLPLGTQLIGFKDKDETLFSHAQWVENILLAEY